MKTWKRSLPTKENAETKSASEADAVARINASKLKGTRLLSGAIKEWWVLDLMPPVENALVAWKLTPNSITIIGFVLTALASGCIAFNHLIWGGWLIIAGGCCDFLDGRLARRLNMQTQSGAFFDSTIDRYMDAIVFAALAVLFHDSWVLALVYLGWLGSSTTPYIRAKAESLGISSSGGQMQRPERVVYVGIGCLLSGYLMCITYPFLEKGEEVSPYFLILAIVTIAWMSNKTSIDRFWSTYKALNAKDNLLR